MDSTVRTSKPIIFRSFNVGKVEKQYEDMTGRTTKSENYSNLEDMTGRTTKPENYSNLIEFLQEIPFGKLTTYTRSDRKFKKSYTLTTDGRTFVLWGNRKVCGVGNYNVKMSSPTKGAQRSPKIGDTGCMITWSDRFEFIAVIEPTYMKTGKVHGGSEIGERTTWWVILMDVESKEFICVISVHCPVNDNKRQILINSLFAEARDLEKTYGRVVIGGDFNAKPDEMKSYQKQMGCLRLVGDMNKVTHINPDDKNFVTRLDYILLSTKMQFDEEKIGGIIQDGSNSRMQPGLAGNEMGDEHDHGIVSVKATILN